MKDYEKKYKDALANAKQEYTTTENVERKQWLEELFPELQESEDEKIRKELIFYLGDMPEDTELRNGVTNRDVLAWLEKQGNCSAKWEKNTPDNKPALNHSVLMKNIHGIAEGEWNGKDWFQYTWSSNIKDSDVLNWMELYELEKLGEEKPFDYESANIQQKDFAPKQEWSEEDKQEVEEFLKSLQQRFQPSLLTIVDWLKSLKFRMKGKEEKK